MYAYKWVSYLIDGRFDADAARRASKRGWEPCPPDQLPSLASVLDISTDDDQLFRKWMRDFRLYRMTSEAHAQLKAELQRKVDEQLQEEFERFQHGLASIAANAGLDEIFMSVR